MTKYLDCLKKVKGVNENECRNVAKSYLACRMDRYDRLSQFPCASPSHSLSLLPANTRSSVGWVALRNLMAKDDFKNLGFKEKSGEPARREKTQQDGEKGAKGELRW